MVRPSSSAASAFSARWVSTPSAAPRLSREILAYSASIGTGLSLRIRFRHVIIHDRRYECPKPLDGKTTTVRILAALTRVDAGQAGVAGFDVRRDRSAVCRRVSVTGQFAMLDEAQAGGENLRMMGRLSRKVVSRASPEPWYRREATYF